MTLDTDLNVPMNPMHPLCLHPLPPSCVYIYVSPLPNTFGISFSFQCWFFVTDCMLLSASPLPRVPRLFQNVLAGLLGVTSLL